MAAGPTIWDKTNQVNPSAKCLTPPNRERLITISRSDLSNPAPALEGKLQVIQFHGVRPNSSVGRFLKVLYAQYLHLKVPRMKRR